MSVILLRNAFPEGITYEAEAVYNPIRLIHIDSHYKLCQLYFQLDFSHNYFLVVFSSWGSDNSNGFQHSAKKFSLLLALTMLNALN